MTTIDLNLRSFVDVPADSHFPIHNLPYGVFRTSAGRTPRIGVAIGDAVLDLSVLVDRGLLNGRRLGGGDALREPTLNAFMALGPTAWREARGRLTQLLRADEPTLRDDAALRKAAFYPRSTVEMLLPAARHQRGGYVSRPRQRPPAKLAASAGRLPRSFEFGGCERH